MRPKLDSSTLWIWKVEFLFNVDSDHNNIELFDQWAFLIQLKKGNQIFYSVVVIKHCVYGTQDFWTKL